jgi:hypothetical protein
MDDPNAHAGGGKEHGRKDPHCVRRPGPHAQGRSLPCGGPQGLRL